MSDERGSITPLIVGFMLVVTVLVGVVVDASAAFLARQRLDSIADAAALAATEGLAGESAYVGGLDDRARIDPVTATRYAAASILAAHGLPGLAFEVHTGERVVEVDVRAPLRLPIPVPGISGSVVTGHAASVVEVRR
jgi:hypothetical protein